MRPNKAETVLPQLHPKAVYIVETICWMQQSEHCLQLSLYLWVELCTLCMVCEQISGQAQCSQNGSGTSERGVKGSWTITQSTLVLHIYTLKICRLFTLMCGVLI